MLKLLNRMNVYISGAKLKAYFLYLFVILAFYSSKQQVF